jgi:hypothetical protein
MSPVRRVRFARGGCAAACLALLGCTEDRHSDNGRMLAGAAAPPTPMSADAGVNASDATMPVEQTVDGGRPPLDGGRTFGMRPDVTFGVRRSNAPRSSARILGWVLDVSGTAVRGAAANAGGAAVASDSGGFFAIDEVYGEREADVFVHAFGESSGHVRVPIRDGETSHAVVVLAPIESVPLAEVAEAVSTPEPDAGILARVGDFTLRADAESFATPWGAPAKGPGTLRYSTPVFVTGAAAAPGSLVALTERGERERLRASAWFEVRVAQVGMELELAKPARVEVRMLPSAFVGADGGSSAPAAQRLYWFDPEQGAFVPRGEIAESAGLAQGDIDRLGHWVVGRLDASGRTNCLRLRVQDDSGAPLPFAALHVTSGEYLESAALFADAEGSACWQGVPTGALMVRAFGASGAGLASVAAEVPIEASAGTATGQCGDDPETCAQPPAIVAAPLAQTCVRGDLSINVDATVQWRASGSAEEILGSGNLERPGPFCLVVPTAAVLNFSSSSAVCNTELPPSPATPGICGVSDCLDLGEIECCNVYDLCDGAGGDEDCDGAVDEGCVCGATTCTALYQQNGCCTSAQACGRRAAVSRECLPLEQPGRDEPTCPDETIALSSTETYFPTGCCRPDGQCGLTSGWGCIARAQASDIWPIESLAPIECTY